MNKDAYALFLEKEEAKAAVNQALAEDRGDDVAKLSAKVELLDTWMAEALRDENDKKVETAKPLSAPTEAAPEAPRDLAEAFLGKRIDFKGLDAIQARAGNYKTSMFVQNEYDGALDPLPLPEQHDTRIPTTFLQPSGFLSSISHATTSAEVIDYFTLGDNNELKAEIWERGPKTPKYEQELSWGKEGTKVQYVAHWIPVLLPALHDWGQLEHAINVELRNGYERKIADLACNGTANYSDGIQGVLQNPKIQSFTAKSGENIIDSVRRMIYQVVSVTGVMPNAICMNPALKVELDLYKDANERYLELSFANRLWGLPIHEDFYLGTPEAPALIVYNTGAATWYTNESMSIRTGTINEQFIENAISILCEGSHALTVPHPKQFCKLEGISVASIAADNAKAVAKK